MEKLWKYKKIGEVCIVERGASPRPIDKYITDNESGINWIKIGDTSDSMYITETAQKIIVEGMKKSRYVKPGDFLLSNSMSFGRPYILKIDGCIHDGWLVLRDENALFDKRFLYYYLSSKTTYKKLKSMAVGGVVNNLNSEMVRNVIVPVPDKEEQSEIADLFDKIKKILDDRKQELEQLDTLVKSRFAEMFGDPVANDKEWTTLPLEEACKTIVDCPHSTPSYTTENTGFMCIRTSIVKKNKILWDDIEYIPEDEFIKRIQRKKPEIGDVVYTREGAILGIAAIIDRECNVALGQRSMLLSPDANKCLSEFLCVAMNCDSFLDNALKGIAGSASPHINVGDIKSFKMIMPPIELQNQFADFVQQVDKSKSKIQKSLEETQLLFDSLMQKYFG